MAKAIERAVLVLCCGAAGAAWSVLFRLLGQQGRLLARVEALEAELASSAAQSDAPAPGLVVGAPIGAFALPDLTGTPVALEDLESRRILFVHWDPGCGFCEQIAAPLAALQDDLARRDTEVVLVSHRSAGENRSCADKAGLSCRVLLQEQTRMDAFKTTGTPVAYLVDERRRVTAPAAVGADAVLELARTAARGRTTILSSERPLSDSRLQRDGLKPGTRAPEFTLPDLDGGSVALADFRGRRVLLVFTDPACGPCDELASELAAMCSQRPADAEPAILMVSRGDAQANRRKVAEHAIAFPVALQQGWKLSREYGIFATPVAFLIAEDGRIATHVASGPVEVLALARTVQIPGVADPRAMLPIVFSEGSRRR